MHLPEAVGRASAGVEFWVQRLERDNEMSAEGPEAENWGAQARLPFHFDKDEEALRSTEQWHHPSCATVTYLTDPRSGDPPTVIFDSVHPDAAAQRACRQRQNVDLAEEAEEEEGSGLAGRGRLPGTIKNAADGPRQACISFPERGKHLAFRGRFLHGCPAELAPAHSRAAAVMAASGASAAGGGDGGGDDHARPLVGRVTLLVNCWRSRRPAGVRALPDAWVQAISGAASPSLLQASELLSLAAGSPADQLRLVVADARRRGGVGAAVSLAEHVQGLTAPLPVAAVVAAQAEGTCLCCFQK
jgi:hypothetical protein